MLLLYSLLGLCSWAGLLYELIWGDSWKVAIVCLTINVCVSNAILGSRRAR